MADDFKISLQYPYKTEVEYAISEGARLRELSDCAESIGLLYPAFSREQCLAIAMNAQMESSYKTAPAKPIPPRL